MESREIEIVIVKPDESVSIQYKCPHCCTGGKRVVEEFPFHLLPKFAKGILEYKGINKVCGNCRENFILTGSEVVKNTLRPWL